MSISSGSHLRLCDNDKMSNHELLNRVKFLEKSEVEGREQRRRLVEQVAAKQIEIDNLTAQLNPPNANRRPIRRFHENDLTVIRHMHTLGWSLAEISDIVGSNPNTVRRRLLETQ